MGTTRIAVLSVSAGAGHVRAAEALKKTCGMDYPNIEIIHVDLMTLVGKLFKKIYADSYLSIVNRHPSLWGYLYQQTDKHNSDDAFNQICRAIEQLNTKKFSLFLKDFNPDQVICTHFLPAELLSYMIRDKEFGKPVWVQVTDFDIHAMWVQKYMAGYFSGNEEVAFRMKSRGIPEETIHVTGIPVMPDFFKKPEREASAREIGIDPAKTTVLMMGGGFGVGEIDVLAGELMKMDGDFQILALAGRNDELLKKLQKLSKKNPGKLFPSGFTDKVVKFMAASDFAITKPGGLTTSECLAIGLPMVIISPIPGQEERNADFLLENGAALKANDAPGLLYRVKTLLQNPKKIQGMSRNAEALGKPQAARKVLEIVLGKP